MKISTLIGTGALLLVFGVAAPAYAQEHPDQQDQGKPDTKPSTHDEKQAEPPKSPNDQPRPEAKDSKPPKDEKPAEAPRNEKPAKPQQDQKAQQESERRQGSQQGGGRRIPDDRFKAHFGQEHHFHVGHPVMVGGRPRFSYGGYNFYIVQAWPSDWGYDDEVYIIDVDGVYYLVDAVHPGVQLELEVIL
jgi:hypothetical protein